jgi:flagellar hook protein FlgE
VDSSTTPPVYRGDDPGRAASGVGSSNEATDGDSTTNAAPFAAAAAPNDGCSHATSRVTIAANLDSEAPPLEEPWLAADPFAGTNYVQVVSIFDALDEEHALAVTFRKIASHGFEYHAIVDAYSGVPHLNGGIEVAAGVLTFTAQGALASAVTTTRGNVKFDGLPAQALAVDFGESIADGGTGLDATISVAGGFAVAGQWQDGGTCRLERPTPTPCAWPMPQATTRVTFTGNLDPTTSLLLSMPWDVQHPAVTSNFTTSTNLFDSLGGAHDLRLYFRRTATSTWDYRAVVDTPGGAATEAGSGTLSFDAAGELHDVTTKQLVTVSFPDAAAGQLVLLDFGAKSAFGLGRVKSDPIARSVMSASSDGNAVPSGVLTHPAICN